MKKLLLLICIVLLVSCSNNPTDGSTNLNKPKNYESGHQDKTKDASNQLNQPITLTLPKETFNELSDEEISQMLQQDGATNINISENQVTYIVEKDQFESKKAEMQQQLQFMFEEINSGELYSTIEKIESNDTFTDLKVYVNREQFGNSFDRLAIFSLMTSISYMYHFQGITDYEIVVSYIDYETNERYEQRIYPELD